jgi:hypothetical protein
MGARVSRWGENGLPDAVRDFPVARGAGRDQNRSECRWSDRALALDGHARRGFKEPIMGAAVPEPPPDNDETRVIERPDGFYWRSDTTGEEHGPFRTLAEAVEDMGFDAESADYEPDETVEEAEAEIGLSGWIDPDTGDLGESWTPRLEDH